MITNYIVEENILQAFRRAEKLKCHIRNCFKIIGKLNLIQKTREYIRFKTYERKINSLFMIYENFESKLVPEHNGKQAPNKSYMNKYQKHTACSYGNK